MRCTLLEKNKITEAILSLGGQLKRWGYEQRDLRLPESRRRLLDDMLSTMEPVAEYQHVYERRL
jgi:hypothetical protein